MNKLSLAFAVGSIGSMLLGVTEGCGTTETPGGRILRPDGGGGGGGGAGTPDSGGPGLPRTAIGRACLKDADCGGTAICLTSTSSSLFDGGPPNGMCVQDCSAQTQGNRICDAASICVGFGETTGPAYCMQGCFIGPTQTGEEKCHNRTDVACDDSIQSSQLNPGVGFCKPVCRNDRDCGARKCDLGSGLCKDAAALTGTLAIGSPCSPSATVDACKGGCLPLTATDAGTGPGMCSAFCTIGGVGCGADPTSAAKLAAACLFDGTSEGGDVGDLGLCGQLCDCNDECKAYKRTCRPFPAAEQTAFGRKGYCGGATDSTTGKPAESLPCTTVPNPPDAGGPKPTKDAGSD